MTRGKISLSPFSAMYLAERFDAHPHPLLRVGRLPLEATEEDKSRASQHGRQQLVDCGLIEHDDLHPFLEDAWQLLCKPPRAVGVAVHTKKKGTDFNAVLVEYGRSTIEAYQADGEDSASLRDIVLTRHEYGGPAGNAVNLLGAVKAGGAGSASVLADQFNAAGQRMREMDGNLQRALASAGIRSADAQVMTRALGQDRHLEASITVRMHDSKVNRTHALPYPLQVVTTEEGGYLMQQKPGADGREWFTVASADQRKLTAKIEEMLKAVASIARV